MKPNATFMGLAIALVQLFDIAIHAATDQLEPLRVTSNVVLLLWLALAASGKISAYLRQAGVACLGVYLLLNAFFLAQADVINPAQSGAVRWMLFLLLALTLAFAAWLIYRLDAPSKKEKGADFAE